MQHEPAIDQPPGKRVARRWRVGWAAGGRGFALMLSALVAAPLAACSSGKAINAAQVRHQTCKHVEAVLSDGPEPDADPVGYAQAQILPLRAIHTSDGRLQRAIDTLASAYQSFSAGEGASSSAKEAVSSATRTVQSLCPGVEL
jgi:hypothetical protein